MKINKKTRKDLITYGIVIVLFVVFQLLLSTGNLSRALSGQLVPICAYVVAAVALNLVVGISGELSLGHAGFMSIGAFVGVVFFNVFSSIGNPIVQLIIAMVCGGVIAGIMGVLIGIPVLRLRGDYLAIVTLAFGEIIKNLINNIYLGKNADGWHFSFGQDLLPTDCKDILNGPMGVTGNTKASTFAVGFALIMFALIIVLNLIRSKHGRAIMAIRDNRIAAESIGLSATKFKLIAFTVSAALTGMAGTLYAMNYASVAPSKFSFDTSINILVFVVLGGMGNIRGSIIAAVILTLLPETALLRDMGEARMLIYAVLLIGIMLLTQSKGGKRLVEMGKSLFVKKKEGADNE